MLRMRLERTSRQDFLPMGERFWAPVVGQAPFQRAALREVPLEMRRIHFDPGELAGPSQLEDDPVMTWSAAPASFPPVGRRGEVDHSMLGQNPMPVRRDLSVSPKSRDAPIGIDVQANVGPRFPA